VRSERTDEIEREVPEIVEGPAGTLIEEPDSMLVEGGYLHSMKLMIEKASETPAIPDRRKGPGFFLSRWRRKAPRALVAPLKRLGVILLGGSLQG
jgi:hypothetical protein